MEFRILGPLEVLDDGHRVEVAGAKQRALLAALLLNANRVVSSDRLIDALWGDDPPETATKAIQVRVSQLRTLLGKERLETKAPGYLLRIGEGELDLDRFEMLVERAKAGDAEAAAAQLREALALWRGSPLAEFASEPFAQAEVARLEDLRLAALEERLEADLAGGRHAELVGELEALTVEHPLRERLRAQLMLALYRAGRQAEALEAYQQVRHVLVDELGIEPGRRLRELEGAILRQDPSLDPPAAVALEAARGIFVGRDSELAQLLDGLEDARAGRGRLFLLVGEPGIGKSRLAEEVMWHARDRGLRVLVGRCWEAGGAPAYWPWVQSLRGYVREADIDVLQAQLGAGAPELAQIVPELRTLFPALPEPAAHDSEGARVRLFDAVAEFLRRASAQRPILLVLDDLHAADTPSLLLLRFVARELGSSRLLVVGALRDVDPLPREELDELLAEVVREGARRIPLGGLARDDVEQFVGLTASQLASPELTDELYEQTAGNPLFVGETMRLLALEGGERPTVPQTVRDVIARRLRHLPQECNRVLVLASVLGREFGLDALARLADVSTDDLLDTLDEAMVARVVADVPSASGQLRFAHVLIRDTLYDGLTTARRVRLHRQAVASLEALHGEEPGAHLAELVHHAIAASEFDKGLRYAQQAGDRALALLAYEEAARLYETALEALDLSESEAETRCELLLSLGDARARAGNTPAANQAFLDAARVARDAGLPRELARAAAGYGGRIVWGRAGGDERLVPLLEQGLTALAETDDELRARLLARLAGALRDEHSRERRDALSREAVELARRSGNAELLAYALDARASAIGGPDTIAERLALAGELLEAAARIRDPERLVGGHFLRFIAHLELGEVGEAEHDLAAATQIANDDLRQPAQLWQVTTSQSLLDLASGRLDRVDALLSEGIAHGERAQHDAAMPVHHLQRMALADLRGGLEDAAVPIRSLAAEYPARPVFRCALAYLLARLGQDADARHELDTLVQDDCAALPVDQEWLFATSLLAEAAALVGDTHAASTLYRLLLPWAALNAVDVGEGFRGSVSRYLGLLAATTERQAEAATHFEDALAANERMGALTWLARTRDDYARMPAAPEG